MQITLAQKSDARQIAAIHKTEIKKGFLSSLHVLLLCKMYEALIESDVSFCVVAKENNEVIGFISGVIDMKKWQKYFLKKYFITSVIILLPKIFSFTFLKKVIETLLYPAKRIDAPKAELLTIAVKQQFQGKGIAAKMLTEFIKELKKENISIFKVVVGEELKPAIAFYEKNGFTFLKNINIHGTAVSRIYVYNI